MRPVLIACSHGTSSPAGQASVAGLVSAVAARRPDLDVRAAFVDVEEPRVTAVLENLDGGPARVVPLLLSAGYHVHVDLAEAVAAHPDATLAAALGPDPRIAQLLATRLLDAGLRDDDAVIVAAREERVLDRHPFRRLCDGDASPPAASHIANALSTGASLSVARTGARAMSSSIVDC